jgi:hypothetical protein
MVCGDIVFHFLFPLPHTLFALGYWFKRLSNPYTFAELRKGHADLVQLDSWLNVNILFLLMELK